jgi:hypothetical protein
MAKGSSISLSLSSPLSHPLSFSLVQIQKSSLTDFARQSSERLTCHSFIREIKRERGLNQLIFEL